MKVPEPRKLQSGTWFIQLRLGGVSVPVSATTKKECIRQAQLIKAEHQSGKNKVRSKSSVTVRDMMQNYIDSLPDDTSPATIRGYDIILRNRFQTAADKSPDNVDWQAVIEAESKKYSYKTLKNSWGFLCSCFRYACYPIPSITFPKQKKKSAERPFLQPDEILKVLPLLKGRKYEIPALLALHSLRRSEIMALQYEDIDFKSCTISVHGATVQDKNNQLVKKDTTKTLSSTRTVPIMIPQLKDAVIRSGKTSGPIWSGTPCGLYRTMEDVCNQLDIPNVGSHGLRHSFASLAYHLGMSELEAMEIGGWSDYQTMRKIYTHLSSIDRKKAENKMAEFYKNANKNANEI